MSHRLDHAGARLALVQLWRYGWVGLLTNAFLYIAYIALTLASVGPKLAMTMTFAFGVVLTFTFNRGWTFGDREEGMQSLVRYGVVYGTAYLVNLLVLAVLVDELEYRHWIVQGAMILFLAVGIFLAQRYWVFRSWRASPDSPIGR